MLDSNHSNSQASPPPISRRVIAWTFCIGTVFGTGIAYGFQKTIAATQPDAAAVASQYNLIHRGMTLTEARSILGPGTEVRQSESSRVMEWHDAQGYKLTATFKENLLVEKQQSSIRSVRQVEE
ncbi:hypothetical protein Lepto7375DRAFT_6781 [Leptolyngbya sp. PCC 7375]|nr:hypothetical protein Lepto7375DRAFT_6781 [Leptolyngbya sp. PCC 7375]